MQTIEQRFHDLAAVAMDALTVADPKIDTCDSYVVLLKCMADLILSEEMTPEKRSQPRTIWGSFS